MAGNAYADCTGADCNQTTVTQMGNVKIINSGPTTVTKLGRNTTVIDSTGGGNDIRFTIPRYAVRPYTVYPNPYYPYSGYYQPVRPAQGTTIYTPQPQQTVTCTSSGCY